MILIPFVLILDFLCGKVDLIANISLGNFIRRGRLLFFSGDLYLSGTTNLPFE